MIQLINIYIYTIDVLLFPLFISNFSEVKPFGWDYYNIFKGNNDTIN
jgi:hypothetical protein